jgi:lipopolysaccharide/colanic/teichoic acid biosynthesis glycosyltransferase
VPSYLARKRCLGVIGGALLLVLALPVLVVAAIAVTLTSPGPIIFRQRRIGWHGREFVIYKLRSMYVSSTDSEEIGLRTRACITPVGRILRSLRIDELPQLVNVLKGDMSLVGPRPRPLEQDRWLAAQLIGYNLRQAVRPGMTGLAQVRNINATLHETRRTLKDDQEYIRRMSLWLDVRILFFQTPWALLRGMFSADNSLETPKLAGERSAPGAPM